MCEIKGLDFVIDTNFILYRSVYVLMNSNTLYGDLEKCLEITFNNYLKMYPFHEVFMVSDSKSSWRKRLYSEYKVNRKEKRDKEDIDWEFVFNTYDKFKADFNNKRVTTIQGDNIEGDDWIRYIINRSNKNGYSVLYVSPDQDLNQMLDSRLNPSWINIQWHDVFKSPKIYLPIGYKLFLNEIKEFGNHDLFSPNQNIEFLSLVKDLMNKCELKEIDKEKSLFVKILSGDSSDNIDSVLKLPTKTNPNKFMGIGEAGALKIWDNFKAEYPNEINFLDDTWIKNVQHYVLEYKKVLGDVNHQLTVEKNLLLNRSLIHLHDNYLPDDIKEKLNSIN